MKYLNLVRINSENDKLNISYSKIDYSSELYVNIITKINKFITDINKITSYKKKINLMVNFYDYLTNDINCIKLLLAHDTFIDTCIAKFESELLNRINKKKYCIIYNKLIKIKTKNLDSIMTCSFSNNGRKVFNVLL